MTSRYQMFLVLVWGCLLAVPFSPAGQDEAGPPIASFGGRVFRLRQFGIERGAVRKRLEKRLGRPATDRELDDAVKRYEAARLVDLVRQAIIEKTAERRHIEIRPEDQRKVLRTAYTKEEVDKISRIYKSLPIALRKALADPDHERQIYEKYMKDLMPYALWKAHLTAPDVRKRLRSLEQAHPPTQEELCRPSEELRRILLERAVRDSVLRDLNASGSEKREAAWNEWLRDRLAHARVEIYDPAVRKYFEEYRRGDRPGKMLPLPRRR